MPVAAIATSVKGRGEAKCFDPTLLFSLPLSKKFGDIGMRPDEVVQPYEDRRSLNRIPDNDLISPRDPLEFEVLFDEQSDVTSQRSSPEYVFPCNLYDLGEAVPQGSVNVAFPLNFERLVTGITDEMVRDCVQHSNGESEAAADWDDERTRIVRVGDIEVLSAHLDGDRIINENRLHSSTLILVEDAPCPVPPLFRSFALYPGSAPVTTPRCARCGVVLCECTDSAWSGR